MSWLARLFKPKSKWLGKQVHAWCYTEWGRREVAGIVIAEDWHRLTVRTDQDFICSVWAHDTRLPEHTLPPGQLNGGT